MKKIQSLAHQFLSHGTLIPGPGSPKPEAQMFADHMANDAKGFVTSKFGLKPNDFFLFVFVKKAPEDPEWNYSFQFIPKETGDYLKEDIKTLFGGGIEREVMKYLQGKYGHLVKLV